MNILIAGSGGREHAIAWKAAQSPRLDRLFIAPGNPGTVDLGENIPLDLKDHPAVARACQKNAVDLVIVGPEAPLAAGLADDLQTAGIRTFGPSKAAACIEASKAFAKQFMARHAIPTARFQIFHALQSALAHARTVDYPFVIKASGLAAGKGVLLPESIRDAESALEAVMTRREFGTAGDEVVIEERLSGPEISLMAFTDGKSVKVMPPAQDHKRLLDHDLGPNTGGMGAYAPAPICTPEMAAEVVQTVLQPVVDGLREEGTPFIGVLYAGLILTPDGVRVLEFNCRFGDPETQVVLPLLDSDLLEITDACVSGNLNEINIHWKDETAVCVVLASAGYPGKPEVGRQIIIDKMPENAICFHAGTARNEAGSLLTAGGRVCGVTAWARTAAGAIQLAYKSVEQVHFEGAQFRRDIAARALDGSAYANAGVSIDAGNRAVNLMTEAVRSTYGEEVLAGIGAFGGLFNATLLKEMQNPVLVASTDGVGTKVKLAQQTGRFRGIGHDIVNHCINDILVQGARPLFFLDYFASAVLKPETVAEVVTGISEACRESGCALIGGETAEMPGVYADREFDLAGTIVGVVEREQTLPRLQDIRSGDVLIGLASSGPHTNGYSLIRKVFEGVPLETVFPEIGVPLVDALLAPHRSYFKVLHPHLHLVKALAHLTGGGFIENIPRVLPVNVDALVQRGSWPIAPIWQLIQERGHVSEEEMYRVFNMGIGMVVVASEERCAEVRNAIPEESWVIGRLVEGIGKVILG